MTDEIHESCGGAFAAFGGGYPLVYFDALRVKIREEGVVQNKAVHLAIGITALGRKEIWGCGRRRTRGRSSGWGDERVEGAGVRDVLIAVVDGLKGFPEAIEYRIRRRFRRRRCRRAWCT